MSIRLKVGKWVQKSLDIWLQFMELFILEAVLFTFFN